MQIGTLVAIPYFTCAQGRGYICTDAPWLGGLLKCPLHRLLMGRRDLASGFQPEISHINGKTGMIYNLQTKYDINHQYLSLFAK